MSIKAATVEQAAIETVGVAFGDFVCLVIQYRLLVLGFNLAVGFVSFAAFLEKFFFASGYPRPLIIDLDSSSNLLLSSVVAVNSSASSSCIVSRSPGFIMIYSGCKELESAY